MVGTQQRFYYITIKFYSSLWAGCVPYKYIFLRNESSEPPQHSVAGILGKALW